MATKYDENVLQGYADWLYSQARWIIFLTTLKYLVAGIIVGFLLGAGTQFLGNIRPSEVDEAVLWGTCIGGVAGLIAGIEKGREKAMALKIEAQRLLCQVQIERNTRITTASSPS